jgi:signal transduction histidine kinase
VELTAYRVVQEALTNALKHARPTRVDVAIRYSPGRLDVQVENDGVREALNGSAGGGHGLLGMNERVAMYGGHLDAGPRAAASFSVHAQIPLEAPT